ncbi:MAG: spoIID [Clostridiales bacterium]|nr:spoIID [Clostridiales bacterium]
MKKIILYTVLIIFLMVGIPLIILGGIGSGIKIPGIINQLVDVIPDSPKDSSAGEVLKIKVYDVRKVIELNFEDYIKGVVAAEVPALFEEEALKAQAIAARTFAAANMKAFGGVGCKNYPEADACSVVHCQAWISKGDRFKNWDAENAVNYWNRISNAVESTNGMVLVYNGELARYIKYHSTSGGKTEDSVNVFNNKIPYLVSVESLGEDISPKFTSTVMIRREEFIKKMRSLSTKIKISSNNLGAQIKIIDRTEGDRVKSIKIGDKTFTGIDIRWAFSLNSADFTVKVDSKYVVFSVKGNGHGVGLSQFGANAMARSGKKYDEILKHYYQGVTIEKLEELNKKK